MIYAVSAVIVIYMVFRILASRPDISPDRVDELLAGGGKLIDVRTISEFRGGHLKGAVSMPLDSLPEGISKLDILPETPIILCCASGVRSGKAQKILRKAGYSRVFNAGSVGSLNRSRSKT